MSCAWEVGVHQIIEVRAPDAAVAACDLAVTRRGQLHDRPPVRIALCNTDKQFDRITGPCRHCPPFWDCPFPGFTEYQVVVCTRQVRLCTSSCKPNLKVVPSGGLAASPVADPAAQQGGTREPGLLRTLVKCRQRGRALCIRCRRRCDGLGQI